MASSYGIPYVAYSYTGIEGSIIAAFESLNSSSVAIPSRFIHYVIWGLYFLCTLGIALTVNWDDPHLTLPINQLKNPRSNSPTIIAISNDKRFGGTAWPGFINGRLIMSIVSSGGVSLYLARRTLYGLATSPRGSNKASSLLKGLRSIWVETSVPIKALFGTFTLFFWLPWLSQIPHKRVSVDKVLKTLSLTASASCIIVWAFICLASIRFEKWYAQSTLLERPACESIHVLWLTSPRTGLENAQPH